MLVPAFPFLRVAVMDLSDLETWVVTDGKPGMQNQCVGLAEALGTTPSIRHLVIRQPWRSLPPHLWFAPLSALGPGSDALAPPWPDLLIATGRQAVAPAMAIRRLSGGRTFCVQIQNPKVSVSRFDLIAAPLHDRLTGPNVVETHGALGRVSPAKLAEEAERFRASVDALPQPRIMVSLGGDNSVFRMTETVIDRLGGQLRQIAADNGAALLITPSRRTDPALGERLRGLLSGLPYLWHDGTGANPYLGWLGLADAVVVTGDSVNMVSEACATGKPVFVVDLEGGNAKFTRFHTALRRDGLTRPFIGRLEHWTYPPLDDTAKVADAVRERLATRLA
ncbi:MAG: mitochondrial fission ELM1 family protein [Minwuia sp.]|nr:mitochondrial fission ELM1 family protein [Minwuia sp.]